VHIEVSATNNDVGLIKVISGGNLTCAAGCLVSAAAAAAAAATAAKRCG